MHVMIFCLKYAPKWMVSSLIFRKFSGEGLTEPPPQTPPRFSRASSSVQGRYFNFFLGGQNFFKFFNATGPLKNWKKQHLICSTLTLFIVPFFLSFFSSFFSFFFFFLGGDGLSAPSNDAPASVWASPSFLQPFAPSFRALPSTFDWRTWFGPLQNKFLDPLLKDHRGIGRQQLLGQTENIGFDHWKRDLLGQIWLRFTRFSMVWTAWIRGSFLFQIVWDVGMTRGHSFKLFKKRVSLDVGRYEFGNRVCNEWNCLAEDVVSAGSLNTFKVQLDHHLRNVRRFVKHLCFFPLLPSMSCLGWKDGKR